jgi:bifunctional non-homologous end joining protein LigD
MNECRWLKPLLIGQFEFLESTPDRHLRHTRFIGLRESKMLAKLSSNATADARS